MLFFMVSSTKCGCDSISWKFWWKPSIVCLQTSEVSQGLKQAPRAWFQQLSFFFFQLSFFGSKTYSLFFFSIGYVILYFLTYVDNIIHTCNKMSCPTEFLVKDLGSLIYFVGVEVILQKTSILSNKIHSWYFKEEKDGGCQTSIKPIIAIF